MQSSANGARAPFYLLCLAGTLMTTPVAGQVPTPASPTNPSIVLRPADGNSLTLSAAPLAVDGEPCVPVADLAFALHGADALEPTLTLSGTSLRADAITPTPGGVLVVRRDGQISNRVRTVVGAGGSRQACVPAADIARVMGGVLRGSSIEGFDAQIESMMNNNLAFLALQTKVQSVSQQTQMMSNIAKADSDAKLNAIRNVRTGVFEETESALAGMPPDQVAWARSFASSRGYRPTRTEIEGEISAAFPHASSKQKIKIHMILLQIMMGDIVGALRSYAVLMDRDMRQFSRLTLEKLDQVQKARSTIIRNFAREKPPRAYGGQDPQIAARAQDKSQRYTQFVQMSTQLMNEIQNTERELVDALQTMHRDLESLWQAYGSMRDEELRTNEGVTRVQ